MIAERRRKISGFLVIQLSIFLGEIWAVALKNDGAECVGC